MLRGSRAGASSVPCFLGKLCRHLAAWKHGAPPAPSLPPCMLSALPASIAPPPPLMVRRQVCRQVGAGCTEGGLKQGPGAQPELLLSSWGPHPSVPSLPARPLFLPLQPSSGSTPPPSAPRSWRGASPPSPPCAQRIARTLMRTAQVGGGPASTVLHSWAVRSLLAAVRGAGTCTTRPRGGVLKASMCLPILLQAGQRRGSATTIRASCAAAPRRWAPAACRATSARCGAAAGSGGRLLPCLNPRAPHGGCWLDTRRADPATSVLRPPAGVRAG